MRALDTVYYYLVFKSVLSRRFINEYNIYVINFIINYVASMSKILARSVQQLHFERFSFYFKDFVRIAFDFDFRLTFPRKIYANDNAIRNNTRVQ